MVPAEEPLVVNAPNTGRSYRGDEQRFAWMLLAPATVLLLGLTIFPFAASLYYSFTDYSLLEPDDRTWLWLGNFSELLSSADFWGALRTTAIFTIAAVMIETLLGVVMAHFLHDETRGSTALRAIYLIPMAVTPVAATFTFRLMLHPTRGVANYLLTSVGLPAQEWLADPTLALPTLVMIDVWQWTPFVLLIVSGALTVLPLEPMEAAKVDGANGWQMFRDLTLPMLMPFIGVAVLFRTLDAFKTFDIIYSLTGGGPGTSTRTLNLLAYKNGIEYLEMGYAAAIAIVMLIIATVFARVFLIRTNLIPKDVP